MASFTYYLDCPRCEGSETVEVNVHVSGHDDLWTSAPINVCNCELTVDVLEELSDEAMELAEDDLWDWGERNDDDERFDRRRDEEMEE